MTGLILKDLTLMKKTILWYAIFGLGYTLLGAYTDNITFGCCMMVIIASVPYNALAYDEKDKWDKLAMTMPLTPAQIVGSKYVLGFICVLAYTVLFFACYGISEQSTSAFLGCFFFSRLYLFVSLPVGIKLGPAKARNLMVVILLLPAALLFIVVYIFQLNFASPAFPLAYLLQNTVAVIALFTAALILMGILSLSLSIKFYKAKEF